MSKYETPKKNENTIDDDREPPPINRDPNRRFPIMRGMDGLPPGVDGPRAKRKLNFDNM